MCKRMQDKVLNCSFADAEISIKCAIRVNCVNDMVVI